MKDTLNDIAFIALVIVAIASVLAVAGWGAL